MKHLLFLSVVLLNISCLFTKALGNQSTDDHRDSIQSFVDPSLCMHEEEIEALEEVLGVYRRVTPSLAEETMASHPQSEAVASVRAEGAEVIAVKDPVPKSSGEESDVPFDILPPELSDAIAEVECGKNSNVSSDRLEEAAKAYALGERALWCSLTKEERRSYNIRVERENIESDNKINDEIRNAEKVVQETRDFANGYFIFSSREPALEAAARAEAILVQLQLAEAERKEIVRLAKQTFQEREKERAFAAWKSRLEKAFARTREAQGESAWKEACIVATKASNYWNSVIREMHVGRDPLGMSMEEVTKERDYYAQQVTVANLSMYFKAAGEELGLALGRYKDIRNEEERLGEYTNRKRDAWKEVVQNQRKIKVITNEIVDKIKVSFAKAKNIWAPFSRAMNNFKENPNTANFYTADSARAKAWTAVRDAAAEVGALPKVYWTQADAFGKIEYYGERGHYCDGIVETFRRAVEADARSAQEVALAAVAAADATARTKEDLASRGAISSCLMASFINADIAARSAARNAADAKHTIWKEEAQWAATATQEVADFCREVNRFPRIQVDLETVSEETPTEAGGSKL